MFREMQMFSQTVTIEQQVAECIARDLDELFILKKASVFI